MSQSRYGVLLVGGGRSHQESYAQDFARDPRCNLIGLTDERDVPHLRAHLNQELADTLGIPLLPDLDKAETAHPHKVNEFCSPVVKPILASPPDHNQKLACGFNVQHGGPSDVNKLTFSGVSNTNAITFNVSSIGKEASTPSDAKHLLKSTSMEAEEMPLFFEAENEH